MKSLGHKYVLYVDDSIIRRDAISRLAFIKMQYFHLLAVDMKSALRGLGYARKNIFDAMVIHYPDNREWTKEEKGFIKIISNYRSPIYLVCDANEPTIYNREFEDVHYLPYSCPITLLQEIQGKIKWSNACKLNLEQKTEYIAN